MGKLYKEDFIIMGTVATLLICILIFGMIIPQKNRQEDIENSKPVECVVINYNILHNRTDDAIMYNLKTKDGYYFEYVDSYPDIVYRENDSVIVMMGKHAVYKMFYKKPTEIKR